MGGLRVLFVCTGNTCRSPMAEGLFRHDADRKIESRITVRSAGTAAVAGEPASSEAIRCSQEYGVDLASHTTQVLTAELVAWADLILAMEPVHLRRIDELGGTNKGYLVTRYPSMARDDAGILDPHGGGPPAYHQTYRDLRREMLRILTHLSLRLKHDR